MSRNKFNPILEEGLKDKERKRREQKKYREKLNLPDDQPIIVEKERVTTSLMNVIKDVGKILIRAFIIGLAIIGGVAIFYPKTRELLLGLIPGWINEIKNNTGM